MYNEDMMGVHEGSLIQGDDESLLSPKKGSLTEPEGTVVEVKEGSPSPRVQEVFTTNVVQQQGVGVEPKRATSSVPKPKTLKKLQKKPHREEIIRQLESLSVPHGVAKTIANGWKHGWKGFVQEEESGGKSILRQTHSIEGFEVRRDPRTGEMVGELCLESEEPEGKLLVTLSGIGNMGIHRRSEAVVSLVHRGVPEDVAEKMEEEWKNRWENEFVLEKSSGEEPVFEQTHGIEGLMVWRNPRTGEMEGELCLESGGPDGKLVARFDATGKITYSRWSEVVDSLVHRGVPEDVAEKMEKGWKNRWENEFVLEKSSGEGPVFEQTHGIEGLMVWRNPRTGEMEGELCLESGGPDGKLVARFDATGKITYSRWSDVVDSLVHRGVPEDVAEKMEEGWKNRWEDEFVLEKSSGKETIFEQAHGIEGLMVWRNPRTEEMEGELCLESGGPDGKLVARFDSKGKIIYSRWSEVVDSLVHKGVPEDVAKKIEQGSKSGWEGFFHEEVTGQNVVFHQTHKIDGLKVYRNSKTGNLVGEITLKTKGKMDQEVVVGVARLKEKGVVEYRLRQEKAIPSAIDAIPEEMRREQAIVDDLVRKNVPLETAKQMAHGCLTNWEEFVQEEKSGENLVFRQTHDIVGLKVYRDPRTKKMVADFGSDTLGSGSSKRAKKLVRLSEGGNVEYRIRLSKNWEVPGTVSPEQAKKLFELSITREMQKRKALGEIPYSLKIIPIQYISKLGELKIRYETELCEGDMEDLCRTTFSTEKGVVVEHPERMREAFTYFGQALRAVKEMHKRGFVHRDLKLENILYGDGVGLLSDFEFCARLPSKPGAKDGDPFEPSLGSPGTQAPELLFGIAKENSTFMDMYSIGVMLLQLARPYEGEMLKEAQATYVESRSKFQTAIEKYRKEIEEFQKKNASNFSPENEEEIRRRQESIKMCEIRIGIAEKKYRDLWGEMQTDLRKPRVPPEGGTAEFDLLIAQLLDPNPNERPSIDTVERACSEYTSRV